MFLSACLYECKKRKCRIKINMSVPLKMKMSSKIFAIRGQIVPQWSNTSSNPDVDIVMFVNRIRKMGIF